MLNRSNAFTGINVKNAEGALRRNHRPPGRQRVPRRDQRAQLRAPFMFTKADSPLGASVLQFVRAVDKLAAAAQRAPVGAR